MLNHKRRTVVTSGNMPDNSRVRLYWENSYQSKFTARVVRSWSEKDQHFAVLDQTLFYPTAGGQASDLGTLNQIKVLDVYEEGKAKGDIVHGLEMPIAEGSKVEGELDWTRRYRHMQRHTAEHIVGQSFLRAAAWNVVAVNMSNPVCTMDFDGEPTAEIVQQAEALANWAVYANTPVRSFWIQDGDVEGYGLRRAPKVAGQIRVVEIENWDRVACGGTHVAHTGEAGPIKFVKFERYKGGARIYFMAGWEALEDYHAKHAVLMRLGEKYSTPPLEVEKGVAAQTDDFYKLRAENFALRDELSEHIMRDLLAEFPDLTIAARVPGVVIDSVGKRLAEWPGVLALLVATGTDKARVILTKHSSRPEDLQAIWKAVLEPLGAKGGGALIKMGVLPPGAIHSALDGFMTQS
jgi:alanyl-tRNA synthetase